MKVSRLYQIVVSGRYPFSVILAEIIEVLEARSWEELREEVSDVLMTFQLWLFGVTGLDWKIRFAKSTGVKYLQRVRWWKSFLHKQGLPFHSRYFVGGSNPARPEKVAAIVAAAKADAAKALSS
jgi:hypothetical protein